MALFSGILGSLGALFAATIVVPGLVREGEVYTMQSADGMKTATIKSCAGGFGGHAHKVIRDDAKTTNEEIVFTMEDADELGHRHVGNNPHRLDLATGIITPNVTSTDGYHNHCLKVMEIK